MLPGSPCGSTAEQLFDVTSHSSDKYNAVRTKFGYVLKSFSTKHAVLVTKYVDINTPMSYSLPDVHVLAYRNPSWVMGANTPSGRNLTALEDKFLRNDSMQDNSIKR